MSIQINGCTVIDNNRNVVNANDIRVGLVTITGSSGDIETSGTITASGISLAGIGASFSPADGATDVRPKETGQIVVSFSDPVSRGTGTITIREGSAGGTIIRSYNAATAPEISVIDNSLIVDLYEFDAFSVAQPVLPYNKTIFLVIPSTAINGFPGLNVAGTDTYSFTTEAGAVGDAFEGGFLICKCSTINWIVAPSSAEVSRNWFDRNNANTTAQQVSGCTGWFVPNIAQLQNPGYTCRTYWDSYSLTRYWSTTEAPRAHRVWTVNFCTGVTAGNPGSHEPQINCVRAFRCVSY